MRKLFIGILAVAVVFGMSMGVMADDGILEGNEASVDQTGHDHFAEIIQRDQFDIASIIQDEGNSNWAKVTQGIRGFTGYLGGSSDYSYANIEQRGHENWAKISQGGYRTEIGEILQEGNDNYAFQGSVVGGGGPANNLFISQTGNDNWSNQIAESNVADLTIHAVQEGHNNYANQLLDNGPYNDAEAFITQTGNDNWAMQDQTKGYFTNITQTGHDNYAYQSQEGSEEPSNLVSDITQTGNDNWASAVQVGNNMDVEITQTGNDNYANVIQEEN